MAELILDAKSDLFEAIDRAVRERRVLFFAGLPGTGKSLLLQQAALLAGRAGRAVHLLQWDVTRAAFETRENLRRYPELNGVTHIEIRRAVGRWARQAVVDWNRSAPPGGLLIGEVPILGNRLVELTERLDDAGEEFLRGPRTLFVSPVPSVGVRKAIEAARGKTIERPSHEREKGDAAPNVLRELYSDVERIAGEFGVEVAAGGGYDPAVYEAVFVELLRERNCEVLHVNEVLREFSTKA